MATNNADNFSNPLGVSTGGLGVASLTTYVPLCGGTTSTGIIQQPSTGFSTSGAVLTSQGASALPQWISPATSNFTLLKTNALSSTATTSFSSTYITSSYSSYYLKFSSITGPTSGFLVLTLSTNNGSSYLSTGYQSGRIQFTYASSSGSNISYTTQGVISPNYGGTGTPSMSGYLFLYLPQSASSSWVGKASGYASPNTDMAYIFGNNSTTTTINNIEISNSAASNMTGSISLYGISQ